MIKLKDLFKEQNEKPNEITLMDIIEDVVGLESKVIDLKKRLTELVPKVKKNNGGRKIDPNFFDYQDGKKDDDEGEHLTNDDKDKLEKDTEFDNLEFDRKPKRKRP